MAAMPDEDPLAIRHIMHAWVIYIRVRSLELTLNAEDIDADTLDVLFEMKMQLERLREAKEQAERTLAQKRPKG